MKLVFPLVVRSLLVKNVTRLLYRLLKVFDSLIVELSKRGRARNEVISCNLCNIMAEGFRFMPLGLVRLRTFRLSAWVSWVQHLRGCSRARERRRRVTQTEARAQRIFVILKELWNELRPASGEDCWRSLARGGLEQVSHEMARGGGRWKSQDRKNVYLSPYVEEPLRTQR